MAVERTVVASMAVGPTVVAVAPMAAGLTMVASTAVEPTVRLAVSTWVEDKLALCTLPAPRAGLPTSAACMEAASTVRGMVGSWPQVSASHPV